jgi:hypothetical protein
LAEDARRRDQKERSEIDAARTQQIDQAAQARLRDRGGQIKHGDQPSGFGNVGVQALCNRHQRRRQHGRIDRVERCAEREQRDECEAEG